MPISSPHHSQRGISLIEVLVTLFVLSIGLLGIAGLQSTGLQAGTTATQRSLAVFHSQEIIERMRANRSMVPDYATATPTDANNCADSGSDTQSQVCTPAQLVQDDLFRWNKAIQAAFPTGLSPTTSITVNANTMPVQVTVTISWTERQGTANSGMKSYASTVFL